MQAFQAKRLPKTLKREVSESTSNNPDRVPEGQRYLQKNGVSFTHIGKTITNTIRTAYFNNLRYLSPLKVFIFLGKGIISNKSSKSPKGHKNPQTNLPKSAPKNISSPKTQYGNLNLNDESEF